MFTSRRGWSRGWWKHGLLAVWRGAERLLPVPVLYWCGYPIAWCIAQRHPEQPPPGRWPACLGGEESAPASLRPSAHQCLNGLLQYLKDRLAHGRWRSRCEIRGLERWQTAQQNGPVLLTFVHFGSYQEANTLLRAHGVPVTTLMLGTPEMRAPMRRYADCYRLFPSLPYVLHTNQLRELVQVLAAGGTVLIALDVWSVRQHVEIPVGEAGEIFHLADGALRLAAKHGATVLPCNVVHQGPWRFRIELGHPVPTEYLTGIPDFLAAGKHLLAEMLPCWRRHPEQCSGPLLECIRPHTAAR